MSEEKDIIKKLKKAKSDIEFADEFIAEYMPFIKSEAAKFKGSFVDEGDDEFSIAMFAFYEAIMAYNESRGGFLKFAALNIKNRLIDNYRKEHLHLSEYSLDTPEGEDEENNTLADILPSNNNEIELMPERIAAKNEIEEFSKTIAEYGLTYSDIAESCPKQERTLSICLEALSYAKKHTEIIDTLVKTKKVPLSQITKGTKISRKTLERHRKYLVAIMLAYTNGFEIIREHLYSLSKREENI